MSEERGQQVGRQKRMEDYQRWSGATSVDDRNEIKQVDAGADPRVVEQELRQIRSLLQTAVKRVRLDISHPPTIEAIKAQLTEEERQRVIFGGEEDGHPLS